MASSRVLPAILIVLIIVAGVAGYYSGTTTGAPASATTVTTTKATTVTTTHGASLKALKVVYINAADNSSIWNQVATSALIKAARVFNGTMANIHIAYAFSTAPADFPSVASSYANQGYKIEIPNDAPSYGAYIPQVSSQYPNVVFFGDGGIPVGKNVSAMDPSQLYQDYFLAGVIAGLMTKSNVVGYVTAFDYPTTASIYNGFKLGAQATNPSVRVLWTFSSDWHDASKGSSAALSLISQGADVIASYGDGMTDGVITTSAQHSVYTFGEFADESHLAPSYVLTSMVYNPFPYFVAMFSSYFSNTASNHFWSLGLKDGLFTLAPYGSAVPASVRTTTNNWMQRIISGNYTVPNITTYPSSP